MIDDFSVYEQVMEKWKEEMSKSWQNGKKNSLLRVS